MDGHAWPATSPNLHQCHGHKCVEARVRLQSAKQDIEGLKMDVRTTTDQAQKKAFNALRRTKQTKLIKIERKAGNRLRLKDDGTLEQFCKRCQNKYSRDRRDNDICRHLTCGRRSTATSVFCTIHLSINNAFLTWDDEHNDGDSGDLINHL